MHHFYVVGVKGSTTPEQRSHEQHTASSSSTRRLLSVCIRLKVLYPIPDTPRATYELLFGKLEEGRSGQRVDKLVEGQI